MRTVFGTVIALIVLGVAAAAAFVYSGVYNVAAMDPHWRITYWIMDTARVRSIKAHAEGITIPAGINDQARIIAATGHYSVHCAMCHGGPGVDRDEFAAGMYPQPPVLTDVSKRYTPAELFWILNNGIKMSGMPSMADDGDDLLWSTVGLLEKLPGMSPDDYNALWMASQAKGGGHGHMNMGGMNMHRTNDSNEQPTPAGQRRGRDPRDE